MKTKELFDELNKRLVRKIMDGEYKFREDNSEHHVSITVQAEDGSAYPFCLWTSNTEESFRCYSGELNAIDLNFTKEEKEVLYNRFRKINDDKKEEAYKALYEQLKKKFEPKNS